MRVNERSSNVYLWKYINTFNYCLRTGSGSKEVKEDTEEEKKMNKVIISFLVILVILLILDFVGLAISSGCQDKYGKQWQLISKGQLFCVNDKGDLKNF